MRLAMVLVLVSSVAAADPSPLTFAFGVSEVSSRFDEHAPKYDYDASSIAFRGGQRGHVELGWKLRTDLALDVHAALSTDSLSSSYRTPTVAMIDSPSTFHFAPYELGLGATYELVNRLWISPWIGLVGVAVSDDYWDTVDAGPHLGLGGQLGVDVYESHCNRFTVLFDATISSGITQYGAGLAYRYF